DIRHLFPLDRVVTGGDSSLGPQQSWAGISFTTKYRAPPHGTYRRHLAVYEYDSTSPDDNSTTLIGAGTFTSPRREGRGSVGGSCFEAIEVDINRNRNGAVDLAGDWDYYRLEPSSRGAMSVATSGGTDTFGELMDGDGRVLEFDDDSGDAKNFRVERQVDDRVYYVRVSGGDNVYGNYTLRTSLVPGTSGNARDRDDDVLEQATAIGVGVEVGDAIDLEEDIDWWRFETRSRGRLVIATTGSTDTYGRLYDEEGELLADDHDSGDGLNFRIDDGAVFEPDAYYLAVAGGSRLVTGHYRVRVVHLPEDGSGRPDLVVEFPDAGNFEPMPGEAFSPTVRVRNRGNAPSEATHLRFYRSINGVISTEDINEGSDSVDGLDALAASDHYPRLVAPPEAGYYYYGACVRPLDGESDVDNNCSSAARVGVAGSDGAVAAGPVTRQYGLPLVLSTSNTSREGFVRIINRAAESGTLVLHAIDDAGTRFGPIEVEMGREETVNLNSRDLESGNPEKGLANGFGIGHGDWRLELATELDIAPLAYVRTSDGFLTGMHDQAARLDDGRYYVPFFNPAKNTQQASFLRLFNPGAVDAEVRLAGLDDRGDAAPGGEASLTLPAGEAREISAQDLETGNGLNGELGDGAGKWRLFLSASEPIGVVNLLESPTGNLTNLSSRGRKGLLPFVLPAPGFYREAFVRIINWSDEPGTVRIRGTDDEGLRTEPVTLSLAAGAVAHFNSGDLESGNAAKGLSGGIGNGTGNWFLELESDLDVEALAFVRTRDGFVTSVQDMAAAIDGVVNVPFLNPASNSEQQSSLRLINPGDEDAMLTISGRDDGGVSPPYGSVRLVLPAGESRTITAEQLESGTGGLRGRFGDGVGKWHLRVLSERPIEAMSLLGTPTGNLTNLSTSGS
ncbi:MAG: hypothetical protein OXU72_06985, partial [Gammaproteobacteria bacterium]|nr:hypothetical protein [Gammaproteobacteria bacterium]